MFHHCSWESSGRSFVPRQWLSILALLGTALTGSMPGFPAEVEDAFLRQMNLGKASLENRDSAGALAAFDRAVQLQSESASALRNLARARMLAGQWTRARQDLQRARNLEPRSAATAYLTGLTLAHESNYEAAIPFLEEAVRLDPTLAPLRFQLANAYQILRQNEKAREQLQETVRLDPLHASAHFKLAMLARQDRDQASYRRHNETFQHLRRLFGDDQRTPTALERCVYTRPEPVPEKTSAPPEALDVRFAEDNDTALANVASVAIWTAAVLDVSTNGRPSLFVFDAQGRTWIWKMESTETAFSAHPAEVAPAPSPNARGSITGNFQDIAPPDVKYDPLLHARNDVLLFGPGGVSLLVRTAALTFSNVTVQAGLAEVGDVSDARWLDYDHDGDLDLALATAVGLRLWQNNGNGRFENVTETAGLNPDWPASSLAAADLDQNVGVDLLVAGPGEAESRVLFNARTGRFRAVPEPPGPAPAAARVWVDDLDNDGALDTVWVSPRQAIIQPGGRGGERVFAFEDLTVTDGCLWDYDNDGWVDWLVIGQDRENPERGAVAFWRNEGGLRWRRLGLVRLEGPAPRTAVTGDFDGDGDADVLLAGDSGSTSLLRNEGGNAHGMLQVRLQGTKTNPSGLGTQVEVRAGDFWVTRVLGRLPLEIGVGHRTRLDSVKTVWTNGIEDNQMNVDVGTRVLSIDEKNVAAGSCPYLYVWDGQRFRFVTDLLGNSPLGLSRRRGEVLPADPEEWVWVGNAGTVHPRGGFYEVEVTEELREVLYLDEAHWLAVDHPPGTEVHSPDKLGPPPDTPSELQLLEVSHRPVRAMGDDGRDRTSALQDLDGTFGAPGQPLPPPLRGMCEPLALTLDFGDVDYLQPLVLALTGWLQYGDASANIAASQNPSLSVITPRLEAQRPDGGWVLVDDAVGMPAGKTKTILCSLTGKLPPDTCRLRLITTFEIRWDRIVLAKPREASLMRRHRLVAAAAELRWRGFSEIRARAPGHPAVPDYERIAQRPPWRTTPWGWCTRYGDVLPLVAARDERLVLLNGGDALRLRFAAADLPPVPPGHIRSFFFHSIGWDKDADPNVVDGDRVEPLPISERAAWIHEFNTRWVPARWPSEARLRPN